jgi:Delta24-sterol reductase
VPFNWLTRLFLNPILHTRKLYQALQESGGSQEHIVQDLTLPLDKAELFMHYLDQSEHIYPLWLCPIKPESRSPLMCNALDTPLAINVGVWGPQISFYEEFLRANRRIETELAKLGGKKWMYAHTYYSEEEFWQIYDRKWYERLREKYQATTLPSIFEKVRVNERYAVNAKRGLIRTILGKAKLRIGD